MATIKTERNLVFVHPPEPGHDLFVVTMFVPGDGSNLYKRLSVQPISQWQSAVDWATGQADMMVSPLRVAAIGMTGFIRLYGEEIKRGVATLSDTERAYLRHDMMTICADVLRGSPSYDVPADASEELVRLGGIPC